MKKTILLTAAFGLSFFSPALTLDEALKSAAGQSPELRAAQAEAQASGAELRAASLWSNPELELESEGLGGDYTGADSAEYSLRISQEFPTSGKFRKGRAVAVHAADAARAALLETGRDFESAVRQAFADAQAAQEILTVRDQQLALAAELVDASRKRRESGAASELEVLRAEMMLESGAVEKTAAEKTRAAAYAKLARLTGLQTAEKLTGDFFQPLELPGKLLLRKTHPSLQRLQALENQADAAVALAKSSRVPDVTFGAGARYEEDGNVHSYLFSASIPLPLFNRGSAQTLAAGLRAEALRFQNQAVRRELETGLDAALAEFETAVAEVSRCRSTLIPKAERAVELIRNDMSGRYGWLERIEVQQSLAETRIRMIEAQRAALKAYAELLKFNTGE
jgi:cobalt-zinc-cadmium efflux system outer membrane protein